MRNKLKRFFLSICALLAFGLTAATDLSAAEEITLQLRWHHGGQFAGYYMAKEKGFFQAQNMAVKFLEGGVGINQFDNVRQGKADVGVAGSELAIEYLKGSPFKSIAAIFQHSPYALMVRESSGYNNPQQLVRKRIYMALAPRTAEIQAMFINEGVPIDKLITVNPLGVPENFADPKIDAFSVYITNEPFLASQSGHHVRLIKPINYGIDFYSDCLFARNDFIIANADTISRFTKAAIHGWSYAFEHMEETIETVLNKYNSDNRSKDHLIYEYTKMRELILPDHIPIGLQNPNRWNKIAETYIKLGMAPEGKSIKSLVHDPKVEQMEKTIKRQKMIVGFIFFILAGTAVLYLWSLFLKRQVAQKTNHLKQEIDAHNATQKELRLALDKYQTLFTSFPLGITVSDKTGRIIETNAAAESILRIDKNEHEKRTIDANDWQIIRTDGTAMPPEEWASVKALKENRLISDCKMGICRADDETTWIDVTAAPLPLEDHGVVVTYNDITEREKLQDTLKLYEVIVSSVFEPMAVIDKQYKFLMVNKAYENFWNLKKEDILGKQVSEIMDRETFYQIVKGNIDKCLSGETVSYSSMFMSPAAGQRYMQVNYYPYRNTNKEIIGLINISYDLTDNHASQELLRQQKNMLSKTESIAHIGSWQWEIATDSVTWSDELFRIFKRDPALGAPVFAEHSQLYLPEDMANLTRLVERAVTSAEPYELNLRGIRSDGDVRHCYAAGLPEIDAQGNVVRLHGFLRDDTDKQKTQRELEKLAYEHMAILDNIPAYIYFKDTENNIIRISESVAKITGRPRQQIEGSHSSRIYPENSDRYWKDDLEVITSGKPKTGIIEPLTVSTEEKRWLLTDKLPYFDDTGKVSGIIVVANDITDIIRAEEDLKASEEKYRKLVTTAPYGIQLSDRAGKILFSNPAHHKILGYADGELVGEFIWEVTANDNRRSNIARHYEKIINEQPVPEVNFDQYTTKDGREIDVQINWDYIRDTDGEVECIISVVSDITKQKALESSIQQAQKMESIGNLAGGIAHDFNNILSPITGMSEILLEDFPPGSPERENVEEILKAGKRGSDLVKQILAFSRQSEHKLMPVRIQNILKEVIKLSRATIPAYIEINQDIQQDCGLVMADPTQIHQIGMNLITNAYHAVGNSPGQISIVLHQKELETPESPEINLSAGAYAVLSISDTGHGIPKKLIEKVFDPYFTTKEQGKGTGLGLAVVYGIVKEYKGDVHVYSEIGKGSTFEIHLPLMKQLESKKPVSQIEENPGGNERILLVDDEESVAKIEELILQRLGYKVTSYLHSSEALEVFRTNPSSFDLVVTDMCMPQIPGDEFARKIKSIRSDVPVIICTGFSETIHKDNIKQLGIDGLLMKPIMKSEFAKVVRKLLDAFKRTDQG